MTTEGRTPTIIERLREGMDGWSGDAFCIPAEVGEEAANLIDRLVKALVKAESMLRNSRSYVFEYSPANQQVLDDRRELTAALEEARAALSAAEGKGK